MFCGHPDHHDGASATRLAMVQDSCRTDHLILLHDFLDVHMSTSTQPVWPFPLACLAPDCPLLPEMRQGGQSWLRGECMMYGFQQQSMKQHKVSHN